MNDNAFYQYIYILQEREFIKSSQNIFKIGKSKQENIARFKQYPKGSKLILQMICIDCDRVELKIINNFKLKYVQRTDIGREYFEGDVRQMIDDIYNEIKVEEVNEPINILIDQIDQIDNLEVKDSINLFKIIDNKIYL